MWQQHFHLQATRKHHTEKTQVAFIKEAIEYKKMSEFQEMEGVGEHLASDDSSGIDSMSDIEYSIAEFENLPLTLNVKVKLTSAS
jgi:hypothetical protein